MLKDILRACWRGMLHRKLETCINVGGLALGLAVFIALSFYVHREFSWDAHWQDAERIHRIAGTFETPNGRSQAFLSQAPWVLGDTLQAQQGQAIETYVRLLQHFGTLQHGEEEFANRLLYYAEASLLDLLQLETVQGSLQAVMADPRAVAISINVAEALFGTSSPLGQRLRFDSQQRGGPAEFVVEAVYRVPGPSIFDQNMQLLALLTPTALPLANPGSVDLALWSNPPLITPEGGRLEAVPPPPPQQPFQVQHYLKLRAGASAGGMEAELRDFMDAGNILDIGINKTRYSLQMLRDVHLLPSPFDNAAADNVQRLWVYAAVGLLVLLISGCNFVMLATLRQVDRQRELGLRKTVGGTGRQLLQQYLVDAFLHALVAAVLAVALLQASLPTLQNQLELRLGLDLLGWRSMGMVLLIALLFTLLSSTWPALAMTRGRPARLLRNNSAAVFGGGNTLRRLLVALQFAIVVVLLLAAVVIRMQIDYTQGRDRGYSFERVIGTRLGSIQDFQKSDTLVAELRRLPQVEAAAMGSPSPGVVMISPPNQYRRTTAAGEQVMAALEMASVGADYFRTLSVPLLAGREFSAADAPASAGDGASVIHNVLLNAAALRALGITDAEAALGQLLDAEVNRPDRSRATQTYRVIGVVADTQFASVLLPPVTQIYTYSLQNGFIAVKVLPGEDMAAATAALQAVWTSVLGDTAFSPLDPALINSNQLRREQTEADIITGSAVLAVVIALLGLYGLVSATVQRRVREIALRKVLGAERLGIVALFIRQFSWPVLLANVLAWPCGLWAVQQWLQRFPFRLDFAVIVGSGIAASVVALLLAWLSVGLMTLRAAAVNPAPALRSE